MGARGGVAVQLVDDVAHDGARVVAVGGDAAPGEVVQLLRAEDVEGLEALLQQVDHGAEEAGEQREEEEDASHCFFILYFFLLFFLYRVEGERRGRGE